MASTLPLSELEALTERELVLLTEILRIEADLQQFCALETEGEKVMVELLLDQLELLVSRLSPEDSTLWNHIGCVLEWVRTSDSLNQKLRW